jgi:misacylated tRNA(Ala) deacylase
MMMNKLLHLNHHPGTSPSPFKTHISSFNDDFIELAESYCYPMGGGQPSDHAVLSNKRFSCNIQDVRGKETLMHYFEKISGEFEVGDEITCIIDTKRRNQLCKMHTAQHLISALANEEWKAETVGNQIGVESTRIDLKFENRDVFDASHLQSIVNNEIDNALEVKMNFREVNDLLDDPLVRINMDRMPPNINLWRTIAIGDIDVCPCAGTHVANTREIPQLEITRVKSKGAGKLRVEYKLNE